jgi:protochlorophyllide reductase
MMGLFFGRPLEAGAEGRIPKVPDDGREHNVVLTGANSGIGKDAAIKLAAGGYNVFIACRTLAKAQEAKTEIDAAVAALAADSNRGTITPLVCDLASLDSVRAFCKQWKGLGRTLDVLVLNAGVAPSTSAKPPAPLTVDGFEMTVGTNHLGHFLMANLLLPELEKAPGSPRLVVTASQVLLLQQS